MSDSDDFHSADEGDSQSNSAASSTKSTPASEPSPKKQESNTPVPSKKSSVKQEPQPVKGKGGKKGKRNKKRKEDTQPVASSQKVHDTSSDAKTEDKDVETPPVETTEDTDEMKNEGLLTDEQEKSPEAVVCENTEKQSSEQEVKISGTVEEVAGGTENQFASSIETNKVESASDTEVKANNSQIETVEEVAGGTENQFAGSTETNKVESASDTEVEANNSQIETTTEDTSSGDIPTETDSVNVADDVQEKKTPTPAETAVKEESLETRKESSTDKSEEKSISSLFDKNISKQDQPQPNNREESILEKLSNAGNTTKPAAASGSGGWGWGSWGSSIINTATNSLHTFTDQVSEGMHTVVESFEASIGAPPPDQLEEDLSTLAREPEEPEVIDHEPTDEPKVADADSEPVNDPSASVSNEKRGEAAGDADWFKPWGVSDITGALQSKTKILVESSLDVLETIGKKTVETIKEQDPGFQKTKNLLKGNQTNLSQILREAKEVTDKQQALEKESCSDSLANYSALFDQYQGLAHLEALEMLSVSSGADIDGNDDEVLDRLSEKFSMVCMSDEESDEDHDFSAGLSDSVTKLSLAVKPEKLLTIQHEAREWITKCNTDQDDGVRVEGSSIHDFALKSFAELTSAIMELFHKSGELMLLSTKSEESSDVSTEEKADHFIELMKLISAEINFQAAKYNDCLNTSADDSENPDSITPLITNVFLEASNSVSYVQDGFKLLLPVLQKVSLNS